MPFYRDDRVGEVSSEEKIFVVKLGGSTLARKETLSSFAQEVSQLSRKGRLVVVHGGGPVINHLLDRLHLESHFEKGLRVTTEETLWATQMALSGDVNKEIVRALQKKSIPSVGISGVDGGLLEAVIKEEGRLGLVGTPQRVNPFLLLQLLDSGFTPVISPICSDREGETLYNVNADEVAMALAKSLNAYRLLFLTNVNGVLADPKEKESTISRLNRREAERLIEEGVISGGMIPKIRECLEAVEGGVSSVAIVNEDSCLPLSQWLESEEFPSAAGGTLIHTD